MCTWDFLNSPNVATLLKKKKGKRHQNKPRDEAYISWARRVQHSCTTAEMQLSWNVKWLLPFESGQTTRMSREVNMYLDNLHLQGIFLSARNSLKRCQKTHREKAITVFRAISKIFKQILTQIETTFFVNLQWAMWILTYHHWKEHFLKTAASVLSERPHVSIASELQSK